MGECETNSFWRSWKTLHSKNNNGFAPVVNGCTSRDAIADAFKNSFRQNSEPNNRVKVEELNSKFHSMYADFCKDHQSSCNCRNYSISLHNVIDSIASMKTGKCADENGLCPEHFHHAPLLLYRRLTRLFNQMLIHAFVPEQFRFGFMIPIVKNTQGNHGDVSNYRGITIAPIVSKIFEHALKIVMLE